MATRKSTQAAPAASVNDSSEIVFPKERHFTLALDVLREIIAEYNDVFCLACAGERSGTEDAEVERGVFRAIQKVTLSIELMIVLRRHIEVLAEHAGIEVEVQP